MRGEVSGMVEMRKGERWNGVVWECVVWVDGHEENVWVVEGSEKWSVGGRGWSGWVGR